MSSPARQPSPPGPLGMLVFKIFGGPKKLEDATPLRKMDQLSLLLRGVACPAQLASPASTCPLGMLVFKIFGAIGSASGRPRPASPALAQTQPSTSSLAAFELSRV